MTFKVFSKISIAVVLLSGCAPHTKLEVSGYRSDLLRQYTKVFKSEEFELQVKYVGMNDSSFTFETRLTNNGKAAIALDCSSGMLTVGQCSANFERRLKSHSSMKIEVTRHDEFTAWLQFKVLGDNPLSCFLNGGNIRLKDIYVWTNGHVADCGTFEFVPISVRLY